MCVTQTEPATRKTGIGYKVFNIRNGQLVSEFCGGIDPRPTRRWLKATGGHSSYGAGWHIFTSVQSAKEWADDCFQAIRKVEYRGAFLVGKQGDLKVIVAKEIYIFRGAK